MRAPTKKRMKPALSPWQAPRPVAPERVYVMVKDTEQCGYVWECPGVTLAMQKERNKIAVVLDETGAKYFTLDEIDFLQHEL